MKELLTEILAFLALFNCDPTAQIIVLPGMSVPGFQLERQVFIRPDAPDYVLVHELYHVCQKPASDADQYTVNELEAAMIESRWKRRGANDE